MKRQTKSITKKKPIVKKKTVRKTTVKKTAPKRRVARARVVKKSFPVAKWIALVLATATIICSLFVVHYSFVRPVIPGVPDKFAMVYTIGQGASVGSVARDLDAGILFKIFVRLHGDKVMAGTYHLPSGASVWRIAKMTATGEIARSMIVIPEGFTVRQIAMQLEQNESLTGKITNRYNDGELFPDTYVVAQGSNRQAVLDLMAKKMEQVKFQLTDRAFSPPAPLKTWEEVVILASIVQKETPKKSEMPTVAGVYLNRLKKGMRLQADPTVVYVITNRLGDMRGRRLYLKHLQVDSPYNTYRNRGLPPAPIANVGIDALRAVLRPADTTYYYFVADGTGGHTFAETLDEHNENRKVWQEIKRNRQ